MNQTEKPPSGCSGWGLEWLRDNFACLAIEGYCAQGPIKPLTGLNRALGVHPKKIVLFF